MTIEEFEEKTTKAAEMLRKSGIDFIGFFNHENHAATAIDGTPLRLAAVIIHQCKDDEVAAEIISVAASQLKDFENDRI